MGAGESKHRSSQRPPDRPHPPGKPALVPGTPYSDPDIITIRWDPPSWCGGARLTGYIVEQRRTGSAHWVRATPVLVRREELTLSGLEPGMRYQFRITAEGPAGRSPPGQVSEPIAVSYHRTFASAPCFITQLKDTTVIENEQVEFSVQVQGTPTPKIVWYKDGFEVYSSRRQRVVTEGNKSTLIIHQAAFTDEGEIKCAATNKAGHIVSKARLTLEAPPTIRLPRQYEEGLLFELGETVRLKVSVTGRPIPDISWFHNGEQVVPDGRHDISTSERHTTLRIPEATRADRGEYQVRACNRLGEDLSSFLVTITDRPLPPGKAHVVMTLGRCVTLSWTSPPDDGGCKIGNYIVEYYRIGWNMWLKAATCRQLTTTLGDLIEGSEYKFRVKAENPYGMSDPSEESDVVFIPDPKRGLLEPPPRDKRSSIDETEEWLEARKRHNELLEPAKAAPLKREHDEVEEMPSEVVLAHQVLRKVKMAPKRGWSEDSQGSPPREPSPPIPPQRKYRIKQKLPYDILDKPPLGKIEEMYPTKKPKPKTTKPKTERADSIETKPRRVEDNVHSSSEFMLVLLPESRETTQEREEERREVMESLKSEESVQVAPPMSLSAPELSSCEPVEWGLLRTSVSSTELMHERAMARMFQEAAEEEAEESLRSDYGIERRRSFERRPSKTKEVALTKELPPSLEKPHKIRKIKVDSSAQTSEEDFKFQLGEMLKEEQKDILEEKPKEILKQERVDILEEKPKEISKQERGDILEEKPKDISKQERGDILEETTDDSVEDIYEETLEEIVEEKLEERIERLEEKIEELEDKFEELEEKEDLLLDEHPGFKENISIEPNEHTERFLQSEKVFTQFTTTYIDEEGIEEVVEEEEEEEEEPYEEEEEEDSEAEEPARKRFFHMDDYLADVEEDTYHPRSMIPKAVTLPRTAPIPRRSISPEPLPQPKIKLIEETPSRELKPILKKLSSEPKETIERKSEDLSPVDASPSVFPEFVSSPQEEISDISILKDETLAPGYSPSYASKMIDDITVQETQIFEADVDTNLQSSPTDLQPLKPILKVRETSVERPEKKNFAAKLMGKMSRSSKEELRRSESETDESKSRKKVRIEEPYEEGFEGEKDLLMTGEVARNRRKQGRSSTSDESEATRVVVSYYSDIVKEYGQGKKPKPRIYLNYEDLKAAAEKADTHKANDIGSFFKPTPTKPAEQSKVEPPPQKVEINDKTSENPEENTNPEEPSPTKDSLEEEKVKPVKKKRRQRTAMDFVLDFALFLIACWFYLFEDERLAIPLLALMVYRQINDAVRSIIPKRWRKEED